MFSFEELILLEQVFEELVRDTRKPQYHTFHDGYSAVRVGVVLTVSLADQGRIANILERVRTDLVNQKKVLRAVQ